MSLRLLPKTTPPLGSRERRPLLSPPFSRPVSLANGALDYGLGIRVLNFPPNGTGGKMVNDNFIIIADILSQLYRVMPRALPDSPVLPNLGQVYLNTTDGHFYGWNGAGWRRLDGDLE